MAKNDSLIQGEPDLGALEQVYRQRSLPADVTQMIRIGWLLIIGTILYSFIDFTSDTSFNVPIADLTQAVIIVISLAAMFLLRRTASYRQADRVILIWSIVVAGVNFIYHFISPEIFLYNVLTDLLIIIGGYTVFPNPLYFRALPALLITAGDIGLLWFNQGQLTRAQNQFILLTLLFGNAVGLVISIHLNTYRRNQFVAQYHEQLAREENERLATLDGLTQTVNRRHFMELAALEFQRARRYQHPFSLLLIDLDYFKRINDSFGHSAGDAVLRAFAALGASLIRQTDCLGRLGGEEFAILLPETSAAHAQQLAERLREQCERLTLPPPCETIKLTISIGVTEVHETDLSPEDTIRRADQALYFVKENGRNGSHLITK